MQGALDGNQSGQDDTAIAKDLAADACMADLLEFQRLTEQLEEVKQWLQI